MNRIIIKNVTSNNERRARKILAFALMLVLICGLANTLLISRAQAVESAQAPLMIRQVLRSDGSAMAPRATFTYRMTAQTPATPLPQGSNAGSYTFSVTGNTEVGLASISFTAPGVYRYELRCMPEVEAGFTADSQIYTIEMYVKGDRTVFSVVYMSDGNKTTDISFIQRYSARPSDPKLMVDPPVKKIVEGNPPRASIFEFQLKAEDSSNPLPEGSRGDTKILKIRGSGEADFGVWSYTKAGRYRYFVSEIDTNSKGYKYDKVIYTITDNVTASDGQLVLSRTVTDSAGKPTGAYIFTNRYSASASGSFLPKTGDVLKFAPLLCLLALAILVAVGILVTGSRRKNSEKRLQIPS